MDAAASLKHAGGASRHAQPAEDVLRGAGLEVLGPCEKLSKDAHLMQVSEFLQDFRPAEADVLGGAMVRVRAKAGQVLIHEGEISDWMMLLLSGTVDIGKQRIGAEMDSRDPDDTSRLAVIRAGAVVGEMSMLDGEPRYASCTALQDVEAAVLTRAAVARLIEEHPGIGAKVLVKITQLLAQRLRNTGNQVIRLLQERKALGDRRAEPREMPAPAATT